MTYSRKTTGFGNVGRVLICIWQEQGKPHLYSMRMADYYSLPSNQ